MPSDLSVHHPGPASPAAVRDAAAGRPSSDGAARLAVAGAVVACAILVVSLALHLRRTSVELRPGQPAPAFSLRTFDERVVEPATWRGRVVVLNFWASWCVSCVQEATDLERVWREYADRGVLVLGVAYSDTRPAAHSYIDRHGITYPCGMDAGGRVSAAYRLTGVPETLIVDADGRLVPLTLRDGSGPVAKIVGPISSGGLFPPEDLRRALDRLLADVPR